MSNAALVGCPQARTLTATRTDTVCAAPGGNDHDGVTGADPHGAIGGEHHKTRQRRGPPVVPAHTYGARPFERLPARASALSPASQPVTK